MYQFIFLKKFPKLKSYHEVLHPCYFSIDNVRFLSSETNNYSWIQNDAVCITLVLITKGFFYSHSFETDEEGLIFKTYYINFLQYIQEVFLILWNKTSEILFLDTLITLLTY